ncbi:MAG: hypothetical protein ACK5YR_05435 [Pirellula sp.]|jgi:hypothetical protein
MHQPLRPTRTERRETGDQTWGALTVNVCSLVRSSLLLLLFCPLAIAQLDSNADNPSGGTPPTAPELNVSEQNLDQLIADLSSSIFLTREKATAALDKADDSMVSELERRLELLSDLEAKTRLHGIVVRKKNEQQQRNIRAFLLEPDPSKTYEFNGWNSFKKACETSDRRTKFTFLELINGYPDLVMKEISSKQEAFERASAIAKALSENITLPSRNLTESDGIALIYCAVLSEDLIDQNIESTGNKVFSRYPFTNIAAATKLRSTLSQFVIDDRNKMSTHGRMSATVNNLFSKWALRAKDRTRMLLTCFDTQNATALIIARSVLEDPKNTADTTLFELAMQAVAKFGSPADLPLLEKYYEDKSVIVELQRFAIPDGTNQRLEIYDVQARDLAIVASAMVYQYYPFEIVESLRLHGLRGFVSESIAVPQTDGDRFREVRMKRFRDLQSQVFPELLKTRIPIPN